MHSKNSTIFSQSGIKLQKYNFVKEKLSLIINIDRILIE